MACVTAEGRLWVDLVDVWTWLGAKGFSVEASRLRFSVADDALVVEGEDGVLVEIDAAEFWTWVIDTQLPKGIRHFETVFGVPRVEGPDLVISFATGSDGDPREWGFPPACLSEWKAAKSVRPATPNALVQSLSNAELQVMVRESLQWRATGVLPGSALREFAKRLECELGVATDDTLQIAESLVLGDAARRFAGP